MKAENKKSIEEYIADLGEIADRLNHSDISLDEAVGLYKQGMELAKSAQEMLHRYEQEVKIIGNTMDKGGMDTDE
jgi:exodeoxyribonuclease VII small subunit